MLSATGLEFTTWNLRAAQLTPDAANQPVIVSKLEDGGFISVSYSAPGAPLRGDSVLTRDALSPADVQELITRGTLHALTNDSGTWTLFDATGTIRPAVIGANNSGGLNANVEQTFADFNGSISNREEGGAIPIESILARVGSLEKTNLAGKVSATFARKVDTGTNHSTRPVAQSSTDNALSGEWARAIVFEMAGGEPTTRERPVANDRNDSKPGFDGPRSSTGTRDPGNVATSESVAQFRREDPPAGNAKLSGSNANRMLGPSIAESGVGTASVKMPSGTNLRESAAAPRMEAETGASPALVEAFDEFGQSDKADAYWLADYSRRALGATPLLLVLALERVAARNSRRAARHTSSAPLSLPLSRRWRDVPNDAQRAS